MTMRRTTKAQEMELLKNELATKTMFLEKLVHKFETTGYLSKDERELANFYAQWINKNAKIIKNYYRPAMVIEEVAS